MSGVRLLVGTRKGAFVLTSDGGRKKWAVEGPFFPGWEIYHLKGSPADPDRLFASQSSGWFGQVLQRSDDGGKTWETVNNEFQYDGTPGTHKWYDGSPHPWEVKRVWQPEFSAATTPAAPGGRSTAGFAPKGYRTPQPRSDTACTGSPCTSLAPTCSSCRSTGTSCAATTAATPGARSAATFRPTSAS